jgi:CheY-like chemotaxis protein
VQDRERGFRLGVDRYLHQADRHRSALPRGRRAARAEKSHKHVLVVDEDASTVKTLTDVLKARGYSVTRGAPRRSVEKSHGAAAGHHHAQSRRLEADMRADAALRERARERSVLRSTARSRVSQTILIVDDEAHLRMLIQQTLEELEDEGVELLSATNGEEALAAIESCSRTSCSST